MSTILRSLRSLACRALAAARRRVSTWTQPVPFAIAAGAVAASARSKRDLVVENALLRHQLLVLGRTAKRPRLTAADRGLLVVLVVLAGRLRTWATALVIVRPATVLRWHR